MTKQIQTPMALEAEEALIGALLINPEAFDMCIAIVKPDDFFLNRHATIWAIMWEFVQQGQSFDYLAVGQVLRNRDQLDEIGGIGYLMKLINQTPSSQHAEVYARLIESAAIRRRILAAADESKRAAINENLTIEQVMIAVEAEVFNVTQRAIEHTEQSLGEALNEVMDEVEQRSNGEREFYMPTGFKALDAIMGGLERGNLHIIGGRPGMGKSSLCAGIAMNAARLGVRTFYVSTEMPVKRLAMRMVAMETGINLQTLKRGLMNDHELARFVESMTRIDKLPLYMDYVPAASVSQVKAKVARMRREHGIDLLIIDGLWQMTAPETKHDDRNQINGYIAGQLVNMAKKDFNIPVLLAHQLNRQCEHRADKRPVMSDLEYGGQLEQNADVIMFIYRDEVYNEATEFPNQADIIFAKNRDAGTGIVSLYFDKKITKFMDATAQNIDFASLSPKSKQQSEKLQ